MAIRADPPRIDVDGSPDIRSALAASLRGRRATMREERVSFIDWALRLPEPKTGRLNFDRYPFQRELYTTEAVRDVVVKKSSQIGVSAFLLRWVLYWADMRGINAMYVFPRLKQMTDFSDARVRPLILGSEYLRNKIPSVFVQNKHLKQLNGFVYFRGSESPDDLESVDADVLALDEYDRLVPKNIPIAERRISADTSLGLVRRVGNPSYPGRGVTTLYEESDKRRWLVKCRCGEEQPLTWNDNVDVERQLRVCRACQVELRPRDIAAGRWVAEEPGRDVVGFHVPKLIVPAIDMRPLVRASRQTEPDQVQSFMNRDLGEAWAPAESRLSVEAIMAASSLGASVGATRDAGGYLPTGDLVTAGIDVHSTRALYMRISRHLGDRRKLCLFVGQVRDFDEAAAKMDAYGVNMCAVDHLPETRLSMSFALRFPGRVYLVNYAANQTEVMVVKADQRRVSVRRVDAIDATMAMIREQRNLLPGDLPPTYTDHMTAAMRMVDTTSDGRRVVRYESVGHDDFLHCEVYDVVAGELFRFNSTVEWESRSDFSNLEDHMLLERSALHADDVSDVEYPDTHWSDYGLDRP